MPSKSITDWLSEGDQLFGETLAEYHELESQLAELEDRLSEKYTEVNKLASIIGKPPVEGRKIVTAQLLGGPPIPGGHEGNGHAIPNSPATIARALQGRGLGR